MVVVFVALVERASSYIFRLFNAQRANVVRDNRARKVNPRPKSICFYFEAYEREREKGEREIETF